MSFRDLISSIKDKATQTSAVSLINNKIQRFGEVTAFQIDSKNKRMNLEVVLKGEVSPVRISVGNYQVVEQDGKAYVSGRDFQTSREWLTIALNDFLADRRIELPSAAKMFL